MARERPFRLVYRSFAHVVFDPAKSDEVFEARNFDLGYVSRVFPGYVLEREDTRSYAELRYQAIGELFEEVFFVVYTRRAGTCRIITAWLAEPADRELWYEVAR